MTRRHVPSPTQALYPGGGGGIGSGGGEGGSGGGAPGKGVGGGGEGGFGLVGGGECVAEGPAPPEASVLGRTSTALESATMGQLLWSPPS